MLEEYGLVDGQLIDVVDGRERKIEAKKRKRQYEAELEAEAKAFEPKDDPFWYFLEEEIISDTGILIKPGKEAVVWSCPGKPPVSQGSVAIKIYKDVEQRSFKALSAYLQGRLAEAGYNRRDILHILSSSEAILSFWVESEYAVIQRLYKAGVPVPIPYGRSGTAIAMELIEQDGAAAPRMQECPPSSYDVEQARTILLDSVEKMLDLDIVHGDLSPYNVLIRNGLPVIIDFPQAVDARYNREAKALLERDLRHILGDVDRAHAEAERLWDRYGHRGVVPELA